MIKLILALTLTLLGLIAHAQVLETRKVSGFSKIEVETGIQLIFTQSNSASLKVEADDEVKLHKIITEVIGNTLKIHIKSENGFTNHDKYKILKVTVSQNNVDSFKAKSGASISITNEMDVPKASVNIESGASFFGNIKAAAVILKVNSGANYKGNVDAASFDGDFGSGAKITLSGKSKTTAIDIDSAAICDAKSFSTEKAIVNADSAASINITVKQSLEAKASSMATIKYYGSPSKINTHKNSLGRIFAVKTK